MHQPMDPPPYEPYPAGGGVVCPKCHGSMRTYERNGVHVEQCTSCRGVFLDAGELEHIISMESRLGQGPGPDWGRRDNHRYRRGGFASLFFSS